jgi:putative transcriptional regulator
MANLQGQFLIASPQMRDPNFHRTIVLIVRDDEEGAMGLVLNRPLELSVKEACERVLETPCELEGNLHEGGPCDGPMMVLHAGDAYGEAMGDLEVFSGVWFITNKDEIESLLADGSEQLKCFIGYAGWGEGQLAGEMAAGAWLLHPADTEGVFSDDPRQWAKLMVQLTLRDEIDPRRIPDDPSVN